MLNIRTLPPLAPGARMLFVGDIHGCSQEFDALVAKLNYQKGHDVLVLVGDLVNKGYDSIGVVERAIEYGAIGVLGNHDASLISKYDRIREGELDPTAYPLDSVVQTAANLPRKCYKYLTELAHIILVPQFDVVVAHAGINPKVNIPDQNLWELLHMRRVLPNGRVTDAQNGGDLWATKWKGPHTIIFGHDARTGLQIHPFAIGLDTGCCYGGDLTAYVLPSKQYVKVPGSKRGVTAKPPMASPETQIGFSPSVELPTPQPPTSSDSVMQALKAVAGSAVVQGSSSRQTPTTVVTSAPQGANSAKTEALKNMLFGKSNSPVPPPTAIDGPTFPSVPATYNSATHSPVPEPSRAPLPRSAQQQVPSAAPPTSAPTSSQSPLAKLVPSSQVVGATVERSAKKEPAATATPAPLATTAPVAPSNGQHQPTAGTNAAKPALPPALPPTLPPAPTAPSSTAAAGSGLAVLRRHLFNSAVHLLTTVNGSSGVVAAATIEMLCGGPMDDHRQELLDDPTISKDKWVAFINGLSRHVTDPKCVGFVADESLLWFQDISANKPDVFDALDRKALEASIALTSSATKTVIKSTLIAVRK